MTQLNFNRLEYEVTNRLRGAFRNSVAEGLLRDRCVAAVKLRNVNQAELFNGITVPKSNSFVHIINSEQVVETLKTTGILDLVYLCINAQQEGNE